jgi:hypothetical protein
LGEIGPAAAATLPQLQEQLKEAKPDYRVCLATAMWHIDRNSPYVLPTLLEVLKDTKTLEDGYSVTTKMVDGTRVDVTAPLTSTVASSAAQALGKMGPAAESAVSPLLEAAKSDNHDLVSSAIAALGRIGPKARAAVPLLTKLAASEDPQSASAHFALNEIAPEAAAKVSRRWDQPRIAPTSVPTPR